jgi:23S rRNA (uracil1939-C5)-methyltransferase
VEDLLADMPAPDVVVAAPPRAGIHHRALAALQQLAPRRIVYVSCNPKTQAEDVFALSAAYTLARMQPVDMFPHTPHIENVALLLRRAAPL